MSDNLQSSQIKVNGETCTELLELSFRSYCSRAKCGEIKKIALCQCPSGRRFDFAALRARTHNRQIGRHILEKLLPSTITPSASTRASASLIPCST